MRDFGLTLLLGFLYFAFFINPVVAQGCGMCETNLCPMSCFTNVISLEELAVDKRVIYSVKCGDCMEDKKNLPIPCATRCNLGPLSTHSR